jgi:hypothetical protein
MTTQQLLKRLQLPKASHALIMNAPPEYLTLFKELPAFHFDSAPAGKYDYAQLFARDLAELDRLIDATLPAIEYDALLWVCYPKGTSGIKTDINRDIIWKHLASRGIRPVTQLAIDEVWSAMRMRPVELVKGKSMG